MSIPRFNEDIVHVSICGVFELSVRQLLGCWKHQRSGAGIVLVDDYVDVSRNLNAQSFLQCSARLGQRFRPKRGISRRLGQQLF